MRFKSCIIISMLICTSTIAQTEVGVINEYIERYIENSSDEVDIQQLASQLLYYYEHPLDLNKADATTFFSVPFFTGFQSIEILEHRKNFGNFISIYELQVLPGFSTDDISSILPFVRINSSPVNFSDLRQIWKQGQHQFLTLAETTTPKNNGLRIADTLTDPSKNHYTGSGLYSNFRYRFDYRKFISFGLNAEKDAGEPMFGENNKNGYDYYSFYFAAKDIGRLKALNVGDFQANFGQGLTLSTGLAFGKSSIISNSKRNFNGFGAYRSLRENAFLRGGALALELGKVQIGTFVSYKKVDANAVLDDDTLQTETTDISYVTSIQEDGGYHRTPSELADKDAISDLQTGFYAEYKSSRGRIGTINYIRKLGSPISPNYQTYNKFNFRGDSYFKNGIYYDYVIKNINIYGEVSHSSHENSIAQIHGALISLHKAMDVSLVYRNYDKSFISLQSNGFGEGSNTSNENGFYTGFQAKVSPKITVLGYYDLFKFNWLRFQTNAPSQGRDFWIEAQYRPNRQFRAYYRFRTETKQATTSGENINQLTDNTTSRHRLHSSFVVNKGIELRNRVEWSIFNNKDRRTTGSLIYQDVIYKPFGIPYQISGRVAYSNIEAYDNRIYSFEQSPLYDYPLFTHGFSGLRFYILARYNPTRNTSIWFKYGYIQHDTPLNSQYADYTIGSGLAATEGFRRQTFTLQIRHKIK